MALLRIVKAALLTAVVAAVMLCCGGPNMVYPAALANNGREIQQVDTAAYFQHMSRWFPPEEEAARQQLELLADLNEQKSAWEQTVALCTGGMRPSQTGTGEKNGAVGRKKYVYLTFDDGPSQNTPKVLEVLKQNSAKATFFVVYNSNEDYYRQIVAGGHTIGLHSFTHDYPRIYMSVEAFFADLQRLSDYVKSITGVEAKIMRFAGGSSNTVSRRYNKGIMSRLVQAVAERGYAYFDWNAQCMDAVNRDATPVQLLENVKSCTCIGGEELSSVNLLLHNGPREGATADALQSIIDYYRGLGYEFRAITPDTPAVHQRVQN